MNEDTHPISRARATNCTDSRYPVVLPCGGHVGRWGMFEGEVCLKVILFTRSFSRGFAVFLS